jgi:hypothetical protein
MITIDYILTVPTILDLVHRSIGTLRACPRYDREAQAILSHFKLKLADRHYYPLHIFRVHMNKHLSDAA